MLPNSRQHLVVELFQVEQDVVRPAAANQLIKLDLHRRAVAALRRSGSETSSGK